MGASRSFCRSRLTTLLGQDISQGKNRSDGFTSISRGRSKTSGTRNHL
jgi:hypothetical protein